MPSGLKRLYHPCHVQPLAWSDFRICRDFPWEERFGGWYVTGNHGIKKHWGNRVGRFAPEGIVTTEMTPGERFDWAVYPVGTSDILAHLLHEHQAGFG